LAGASTPPPSPSPQRGEGRKTGPRRHTTTGDGGHRTTGPFMHFPLLGADEQCLALPWALAATGPHEGPAPTSPPPAALRPAPGPPAPPPPRARPAAPALGGVPGWNVPWRKCSPTPPSTP